MSEIKQAENPCIKCGSWYRKNSKCNKCETAQPVPEEFYGDSKKAFTKEGKECVGRDWDKKSHKFKHQKMAI